MQVYRITLSKWSEKLVAAGNSARWNSKGNFVIYTAASRALACLENVVHRSGEGLSSYFRVMVISIPAKLKMEEIDASELSQDWSDYMGYPTCQEIGDRWYDEAKTAVLKVPSAIIPTEFNYILNLKHPDFSKIKLLHSKGFYFDPRLKKS